MIDLVIKGFQSIEEVSFTIDGFTALVGRSNIGKSAVVRAIQSALTNALGTDFVRHGVRCSRRTRGTKKCRCQCSVHIQTEGLDLLWEKGDEINQYTYNGQLFSRVDRGVPDFLLKDFSLVKVGDRRLLLQVADQSEPIFLLNQSGNVVADVLSDVAKLDDINAAMSLVEKDRREFNSVLKVREKDILSLRNDLLWYEGLDQAAERSKKVSQQLLEIRRQTQESEQLECFYVKLQSLATGVRFLRQVDAVTIPEIGEVETTSRGLLGLLDFELGVSRREEAVERLTPVEAVALPDEIPLVQASQELDKIEVWLARSVVANDLRNLLQRWKVVEAAREPIEISTQGIQDLVQLSTYLSQHEALAVSLGRLEVSLAEVADQETATQKEWSELGVCPTCTQPVSGEHSHLNV